MTETIQRLLQVYQEDLKRLEEESVNYLYMAGLLCYEAALRQDRLFFFGEGEGYFTAMRMAYHMRLKYPHLQVALLQNCKEDLARFESYAEEGDVVVLISKSPESESLHKLLSLAKERGVKSVGMSALHNKSLLQTCDVNLVAYQQDMMHIEHIHYLSAQIILQIIDTVLTNEAKT